MTQELRHVYTGELSNQLDWLNHTSRDEHIIDPTKVQVAIPILDSGNPFYGNSYRVNNCIEAHERKKQEPIRTITEGNPNDTTLEVGDLPYGSLIAIDLKEIIEQTEETRKRVMLSVEKDPNTQNERYLHMQYEPNRHIAYPALPITAGGVRHVRIEGANPIWKLERITQIELLTWGKPKLPEVPTELKRGAIHRLFRR